MSQSRQNVPTVLVVGVIIVFCFTVAAVVAISVAVPEGANKGSLVAILMGSLAPTIASLVALAKVSSVSGTVDQVAEDTTKLTNGLMDSKIRAAVADVLPAHLVDPNARAQIASDVERRDNHNAERDVS